MKNSVLSSILILLLGGCSLSLHNTYKPSPPIPEKSKDSFSWFREDTGRYLFQSSISIFRNNYTGLLFIKPLDESRRILFITETGIKIFDMEFFKTGDFKVHYLLEAMNRKSVVNTLGNDLSLMIYNIADNDAVKIMKDKKDGRLVVRSKDKTGNRYCIIDDETGKVADLIRTGILTNKVKIKFYSGTGILPDSIDISHCNLKLDIQLTRINE